MSSVFISYARPSEARARAIADALRSLGHSVWRDDELPPHRAYAEVIEERLRAAKAVLVIWTADAVKSQWVRAEADLAREAKTLVQLSLDGALPPLPFNQIQCADLRGWSGEPENANWRKVVASIAELAGSPAQEVSPALLITSVESQLLRPETPNVTIRPFVMVSGADTDGVAAGLTEDIRIGLASHSTLTITTGVAPVDQDYLLEGSVQRSGERLRASFRLSFAFDAAQVWTERFDGSRSDLFEFQDRVALAVAANVEAAVRVFEADRAFAAPEDTLNTRLLYFRAIKYARQADPQGFTAGLRCLERVLELKPDHRHALGSAIVCCMNLRMQGCYEEGQDSLLVRKGLDYGHRALQLSDTDPYSTSLAAFGLAYFGHPVAASISIMDRMLALAPSLAFAWFWSGTVRLIAGDLDLAATQLERSLRLDPRMAGRAIVWPCWAESNCCGIVVRKPKRC